MYGSRGVECTAACLLEVDTRPTRSFFVACIGVMLVVDLGVCATVFIGTRSISRRKVFCFVDGFEVWVERCLMLVVDFGICATVFVGTRTISRPKVTGLVVGFEVWVKRCRMRCCSSSESANSARPLGFCGAHRWGGGVLILACAWPMSSEHRRFLTQR